MPRDESPTGSEPAPERWFFRIPVGRRLVQLARRPGVRLGLTALLLIGVFYQVNWRQLGSVLATSNPEWLLAGLAFFIPQWLCSTWRWRRLVAPAVELSWPEAWAQQCQAAAWNLVVPGKAGDVAKAAALYSAGIPAARAAALLAAEKAGDLLALALLAALAWTWPAGAEMLSAGVFVVAIGLALGGHLLRQRLGTAKAKRGNTLDEPPKSHRPLPWEAWLAWAAGSLVLWQLHLGQILFFAWACGLGVDWGAVCQVVPLALVVGLLPVSWWGMGTRDAVLVGFWVPPARLEQLLLLAVLLALRYLAPGLVGMLWMNLTCLRAQPVAEPPRADSVPA